MKVLKLISGRWSRLAVALLALGSATFATLTPSEQSAQAASDPAVQVIILTNLERARVGAPPLTYNPNLTWAAQTYAAVLANGPCWGHTCGPVPYFVDRTQQAGYENWSTLGENLAGGQRTPESVVAAWMASPGHRQNLLNPNYTEIGVGMAVGGQYGIYWSQEFGARWG